MSALWHRSSELPTRPAAACLVALSPPEDGYGWCISPVFYTWDDARQCWIDEENDDEQLEPGGNFRWAYEADVLAELTQDEAAAHG